MPTLAFHRVNDQDSLQSANEQALALRTASMGPGSSRWSFLVEPDLIAVDSTRLACVHSFLGRWGARRKLDRGQGMLLQDYVDQLLSHVCLSGVIFNLKMKPDEELKAQLDDVIVRCEQSNRKVILSSSVVDTLAWARQEFGKALSLQQLLFTIPGNWQQWHLERSEKKLSPDADQVVTWRPTGKGSYPALAWWLNGRKKEFFAGGLNTQQHLLDCIDAQLELPGVAGGYVDRETLFLERTTKLGRWLNGSS